MKKNLLYALLITAAFLVSCGDDEPQIDPIVGTWELDEVSISSPPAPLAFWLVSTGLSTTSLYGEVFYEIEFKADNTYERELRFADGSRANDSGEWEIDGDDLDLDQDDSNVSPGALFTEFEISDQQDDEIVLIGTRIQEGITQESSDEINALVETFGDPSNSSNWTDEEIGAYVALLNEKAETATIEITLTFSKED